MNSFLSSPSLTPGISAPVLRDVQGYAVIHFKPWMFIYYQSPSPSNPWFPDIIFLLSVCVISISGNADMADVVTPAKGSSGFLSKHLGELQMQRKPCL